MPAKPDQIFPSETAAIVRDRLSGRSGRGWFFCGRLLSFVFCFPLVVALLWLTGCGGGGGGDSAGVGVDPVETEITTVLDAIAGAVANKDTAGVMSWMDSNLLFFSAQAQGPERYGQFQTRLQNFFNGATVLSFSFPNASPGISGGETSARFRGVMTYSWQVGQGAPQQRQENIELVFERVGKWGVTSFSGVNLEGLTFPPTP